MGKWCLYIGQIWVFEYGTDMGKSILLWDRCESRWDRYGANVFDYGTDVGSKVFDYGTDVGQRCLNMGQIL